MNFHIQARNRLIGGGHPTLVLAEMASAHEGNPEEAHQLVDIAAEAGAEAIQVQMYVTEQLVAPTRADFEMTKSYELPSIVWKDVIAHAQEAGLLVWANVFDKLSLKTALEADVDAIKLHCSDTTNPLMLDAVAQAGRPLSLSAGGSTLDELDDIVARLRRNGVKDLIIMHGFQAFPTQPADARLSQLVELRKRFQCVVGYQDHTDGGSERALSIPLLALGLGASIIEKHFTRNRSLQGADYISSLDPEPFAQFIELVREADGALGFGKTGLSDAEQTYRQRMKKRLVAVQAITAGQTIEPEMIMPMRAEQGLLSSSYEQVLGRTARLDIQVYEPITEAHLL